LDLPLPYRTQPLTEDFASRKRGLAASAIDGATLEWRKLGWVFARGHAGHRARNRDPHWGWRRILRPCEPAFRPL